MITVYIATATLAAAPTLKLEAEPVILGRTESVSVVIEDDEGAANQRPLRLAVNVGSFAELRPEPGGVHRTVYVPPATRFPQVALVALWRESGPEAPITFFRVPLHGATQLSVATTRGASVRVFVEDRAFGPVTADARGQAPVPILVPPGVKQARVEVTPPSGTPVVHTQALDVPPYNELTAAVTPHQIEADGKQWARIEVMYELGGAETPADRIELVPSVGTARLLSANRGRYVYRYEPPAGTVEPAARIAVRVRGDAAAQASLSLALGAATPAKVMVFPPNEPLPADGRSQARVRVLVLDAEGLGVPRQQVRLSANEVPLAPADYAGDGVYEATLVAPETYPPGGVVRLSADLARNGAPTLTARANYQLLPTGEPSAVRGRLEPSPLPADGTTRATLLLEVADAVGRPVSRAALFVKPSHGQAAPLREVGDGRYAAEYVPPSGVPEGGASAIIEDTSGAALGKVNLQLREPPPRLEVGGRAGAARAWRGRSTARLGAELWTTLSLAGYPLSLGLAADATRFSRALGADSLGRGVVMAGSLTALAAYELSQLREVGFYAVLGAGVAGAKLAAERAGLDEGAMGLRLFGGVGAELPLGPGRTFVELGVSRAPVSGPSFQLDMGGVEIAAGYRLGVVP